MIHVFVYGTLKTGHGNHVRFAAPFTTAPGVPATVKGYTLYGYHDGIPYAVPDERGHVIGELLELDPAALPGLDRLEGVPEHYERRIVTAYPSAGLRMAIPSMCFIYTSARAKDHGYPALGPEWRPGITAAKGHHAAAR